MYKDAAIKLIDGVPRVDGVAVVAPVSLADLLVVHALALHIKSQ